MNKLLIGLLVLAAGTVIYFLTRSSKPSAITSAINKEQLIGQWSIVPSSPNDTVHINERYSFQPDSIVLHSSDSTNVDTLYYSWKGEALLVKKAAADTTGVQYHVTKLVNDSLELQTADSKLLQLRRIETGK